MGGQENVYINNCSDLRWLQSFRDWSTLAFGQDGVFTELKSAVEKGLSKSGKAYFGLSSTQPLHHHRTRAP
jgi:hypothetical protein